MSIERPDKRKAGELRPILITPQVNPYAEGSVQVEFGNTKLLVTATIEKEAPKWMGEKPSGWITAEYGMLPRSTHTRNKREASSGKQGGRTLEIQRLIGRALRAAIDLNALPGLTIRIDCDVLVADGGTRTAAISGGWVALAQALKWAHRNGLIANAPQVKQIAAVSVGVVEGSSRLDLCYEEDSSAEFDLNLVFNDEFQIIEIQGTAEKGPIDASRLEELIALGKQGTGQIFKIQQSAAA